MSHMKTGAMNPLKTKKNKRRLYMPEPLPRMCAFPVTPPVYQVSFGQEAPRPRCRQRVFQAEFNHTSFLSALRNCVFNLQRPHSEGRRRHRRRPRDSKECVQDLICSLKCDVQKMSKKDSSQGQAKCADPFFILPAMMCKLNKLEENIIRTLDCEKKLSRKKEMLITSKCIRKALLDQLRCDEKMLAEKRKEICCLIKSLHMFEKQILSSAKGLTTVGIYPPQNTELCRPVSPGRGPCDCPDKEDCCGSCPGKAGCESPPPSVPPTPCCPNPSPPRSPRPSSPRPCTPPACSDPCISPCLMTPEAPKNYDITGMNMVYTKSNIENNKCCKPKSDLQKKISWDSNAPDCQIDVIKDGNECDICDDPVLQAGVHWVSKKWRESARLLIEAFPSSCPC